MNGKPEFDSEHSDPILDQLLEQAQWKEPTEDQIDNMKDYWSSLSHKKIGWWNQPAYRAAAGILIFVTGALLFFTIQNKTEKNSLSREETQDLPDETNSNTEKNTSKPFQPKHSRIPTTYELLIVENRLKERETSSLNEKTERLNQVIREMVNASAGDREKIAQALIANRSEYEEILISSLPYMENQWLIPSIQLLGVIGSESSIPHLVEMMKLPQLRSESLKSYVSLANTDLLAKTITELASESERKFVCKALLKKNDQKAYQYYMVLVKEDRTRSSALGALSEVRNLNYDYFFHKLNSQLHSEQVVAAIILGNSNNTEVISRLLMMVNDQSHSRSAIVALLASDHQEAHQFIESASRYPVWSAQINSAKNQLSTLNN